MACARPDTLAPPVPAKETRMAIHRTLAVVVLAAAAAPAQIPLPLTAGSGCCGERQPMVNDQGTVVAWANLVGGVNELFTVPADGGAPVRRTTGASLIVGFGTFGNQPSITLSADGTRITYWNAAGVHVVDTVAGNDRVLYSGGYPNHYPSIDPTGAQVVFQAVVGSSQEVFLVPFTGGPAVPLTATGSGGDREPDVHGNLVVYQAVAGGNLELFAYDLAGQTTRQITAGSGGGNRYPRFTADGRLVVYEVVSPTTSSKEVWVVDPLVGVMSQRAVTTVASGGDRLGAMSQDGEIAFQSVAGGGLEVFLIDQNGTNLTQLTTGGLPAVRRPSVDAHGHLVVYQGVVGGTFEVFRIRRCAEAAFAPYGAHGIPSVGTLASFQSWSRCQLTLGLSTSLAPGTAGLFLLGFTPVSIPIPGAPGNTLYVIPSMVLPLALDGLGRATFTFPVPPGLAGVTAHYQWGLFDVPANPTGVVASEGTTMTF
jgi:hypothetical protein